MRAPTKITVAQAWEAWEAGAKDGTVRTRGGDRYKPSTLRSYEQVMRLRILDDVGAVKLSDVTRRDVQQLANRMLADGCDASTIRNMLMPVRVIFRRAIQDDDVAVNPCANLRLPAVRGRRDRVASPAEAAALIAALDTERPLRWPSSRRAPRAPLGGRRSRSRCHPRRAELGHDGGSDRAQEPSRPAHRADRR
jgi:integrase